MVLLVYVLALSLLLLVPLGPLMTMMMLLLLLLVVVLVLVLVLLLLVVLVLLHSMMMVILFFALIWLALHVLSSTRMSLLPLPVQVCFFCVSPPAVRIRSKNLKVDLHWSVLVRLGLSGGETSGPWG